MNQCIQFAINLTHRIIINNQCIAIKDMYSSTEVCSDRISSEPPDRFHFPNTCSINTEKINAVYSALYNVVVIQQQNHLVYVNLNTRYVRSHNLPSLKQIAKHDDYKFKLLQADTLFFVNFQTLRKTHFISDVVSISEHIFQMTNGTFVQLENDLLYSAITFPTVEKTYYLGNGFLYIETSGKSVLAQFKNHTIRTLDLQRDLPPMLVFVYNQTIQVTRDDICNSYTMSFKDFVRRQLEVDLYTFLLDNAYKTASYAPYQEKPRIKNCFFFVFLGQIALVLSLL